MAARVRKALGNRATTGRPPCTSWRQPVFYPDPRLCKLLAPKQLQVAIASSVGSCACHLADAACVEFIIMVPLVRLLFAVLSLL